MKCVILLCLAVYCIAQEPVPCTSPNQWESRIIQSDPSKKFLRRGKLSYDETNKRLRIVEEVEFGSTRDYYDVLLLHNVQQQYVLNLRTRKCNVTALTRPFRPFGIPPFAKFEFEGSIGPVGLPGESLPVQTWAGTFESGDRFLTTVEIPSCIPTQHFFSSNETGLVISDFFDTTLGIVDPMVFIPPSECVSP